MQRSSLKKFLTIPKFYFKAALITIALVISFAGVNTVIIEWNKALQFPAFLSEFEHYAQAQELKLAELTEFLTDFESTGHFLLCMLVVAIIPALGEEFLFRGILQNILRSACEKPAYCYLGFCSDIFPISQSILWISTSNAVGGYFWLFILLVRKFVFVCTRPFYQ